MLNRKLLADYLFANAENAQGVNAIVHPAVWRDFLRWHGRLSAERKAIRANVKREAPMYHGSIVLRYLFGKLPKIKNYFQRTSNNL